MVIVSVGRDQDVPVQCHWVTVFYINDEMTIESALHFDEDTGTMLVLGR